MRRPAGRAGLRRAVGLRPAGRGRPAWRRRWPDRAALAAMAAAEIGHFRLLEDHLARARRRRRRRRWRRSSRRSTPTTRATAPRSWLEALVKAYVGDGLAADFYREVAGLGRRPDRRAGAAGAGRHRAQRVRRARGAGGDRGRTGRSRDRLALWGRRLLGEAVTQAQRVVAERDELAEFIVRARATWPGSPQLLKRLQSNHGKRMAKLRPPTRHAEQPGPPLAGGRSGQHDQEVHRWRSRSASRRARGSSWCPATRRRTRSRSSSTRR